MGKRKKLENVCASKTSLTETAMKRPRKVELIAISAMAAAICHQMTSKRESTPQSTTSDLEESS